MHSTDSQLVPAILLVMTGPILLFLIWVFCGLQREIRRSHKKRIHLSRVIDLRGDVLYLRRVHRKEALPAEPILAGEEAPVTRLV